MDGSVMGLSVLSGSDPGFLVLEPSSLRRHQQALIHHVQDLAPFSTTQHVNASQDIDQTFGFESKGTPNACLLCSKVKSAGTSDEDEPSFTEDGGDGHVAGGTNKDSPWHRMKWTDSMVKLLISIVLFVGEDGTVDNVDGSHKRKCGVLQKKGKWKSVSRFMMDRGCFVSPQQCEDKFNDLNKRYKRLNDILGQGTARCVVENPDLLNNMDNVSLKTKEDVKKILSSKHLFYKEMCSYHSGSKSLISFDLDFPPSIEAGLEGKTRELIEMGNFLKEENTPGDEQEDDDGEEEEDEADDDDDNNDHKRRRVDVEIDDTRKEYLKYLEGGFRLFPDQARSNSTETMNSNLMTIMGGGSNLTPQEEQWMGIRILQLEEQKVALQAQSIELEKQRFNWQKLSSKKDRETQKMKMDMERMKSENESMSLQLKQKELGIEFKRSEVSLGSIALILERLQSKEQYLERGEAMN